MAEYLIKDTTLTAIADAVRAKTEKTDSILVSNIANEILDIATGIELNFDVVGGTTQPSSATENTIWVNTDQEITAWIFSATEPTNLTEGMVWIYTGAYSTAQFNALKKNGIQVYPISAKQYVSGAWVKKTAKSYQGGEWVPWWDGTLYDAGNEYEFITGGWKARALAVFSGGGSGKAPTITKNTDSVTITIGSGSDGGGVYEIVNDIDVSNYNTLTFIGSTNSNGIKGLVVYDRNVSSLGSTISGGFSNALASKRFSDGFSGNTTVDLSGIGKKVCIGIAVYNNSTSPTVTMQKLVLS